MEKIITILHFLFFLINTIYPFVTKKNWFDLYYLILLFGIGLSWTLFNGECIISLLFKKLIDPNYKIGENNNTDDLFIVFGEKYKPYMKYIIYFISLLQGYGIYLVLIRNHLNGWYVVLFLIYMAGLKITAHNLYQTLFLFLFLFILIKIINKLWN